jgi:hypothetical protein
MRIRFLDDDEFWKQMVPWVHYIPLSVEGDELYNLWTYFLGKDDGVFMAPQSQLGKDGWKLVNHEQTLKQIGIDASAWSHAHARQIDWEIYSYRVRASLLLLLLVRLISLTHTYPLFSSFLWLGYPQSSF